MVEDIKVSILILGKLLQHMVEATVSVDQAVAAVADLQHPLDHRAIQKNHSFKKSPNTLTLVHLTLVEQHGVKLLHNQCNSNKNQLLIKQPISQKTIKMPCLHNLERMEVKKEWMRIVMRMQLRLQRKSRKQLQKHLQWTYLTWALRLQPLTASVIY